MSRSTIWRLFLVTTLIVGLASAAVSVTEGDSYRSQFEEFKTKFDRSYSSPAEEQKRFAIFVENMEKAAVLATKNPHAHFGATIFSDLSSAEFVRRLNNKKPVSDKPSVAHAQAAVEPPSGVPKRFDWRGLGAVSAVKNQGQCGSCWAVSAVESLESAWFLADHKLVNLSVQEIVSCCNGPACFNSEGCNGGFNDAPYNWLMKKRGGWITSEDDYPYTSGHGITGKCDLPKPNVAQLTGYVNVTRTEPGMATALVNKGPLSICVDASSWQSYQGGIMTWCPSNDGNDHCVLLTGYSFFETKIPYWIVKNSWGPWWGEDGYIRLAYGSNQCDLTDSPIYPLVKSVGPSPTSKPTPLPPPPPPTPVPPPTPHPGPSDVWYFQCDSPLCLFCNKTVIEQNSCIVGSRSGKGEKLSCVEDNKIVQVDIYPNTDCTGTPRRDYFDSLSCGLPDEGSPFKFQCP